MLRLFTPASRRAPTRRDHRCATALLAALIVEALVMGHCAHAQPPPRSITPGELGRTTRDHLTAVAVIDRVVLVSDVASYVEELSRWTADAHWPVLFQQHPHTPLFVRRFQPRQLIALAAVDGQRTPGDALKTDRPVAPAPQGLVIADAADPAWTAAVALALGHAQPLAWIDSGINPDANARLSHDDAQRLRARIDNAADVFRGSPPTITLCLNVPARVNARPPDGQRPSVPAQANPHGPLATTDWLGRDAHGQRESFVGWIFGDEQQAAYMAMCSLFLPRDDWLMVNTYPEGDNWRAYSMQQAGDMLRAQGVRVSHVPGVDARLTDWSNLFARGGAADVFFLNSKGGGDWFELRGATAHVGDVPVFTQPTAVHMIHSYSAMRPGDDGTIAGRFLDHGAYAYIGSVEEPLLGAFVPPAEVVQRVMDDAPLLIAARQWAGPLSRAWRITTIGDPVMITGAPRRRIHQAATYGVDLRAELPEMMRAADADGHAAGYVTTLRVLHMLGKDDVAVRLWQRIVDPEARAEAAQAVIMSALIAAETATFLEVCDAAQPLDDAGRDVLWQRLGNGLEAAGPGVLRRLEANLRGPNRAHDLKRIAPHLRRQFGAAHVRALIRSEVEQETRERIRSDLEKLFEEHSTGQPGR